MKKITFLLFSFLGFQLSFAQNTCATAVAVSTGLTTVGTINGTAPTNICGSVNGPGQTFGEWYSFTATVDGEVNITTNLAQNDGFIKSDDTRVIIYTGTCVSLTCVAENDDISSSNYLSDVTFPVTNGTTYIFVWDNRWSSVGFDFVLTETAISCYDPNTFSANSITTTTFDLTWVNDNSGTPTWEIEWGSDGFLQGTGTMVTGIATNNYLFDNLMADTSYDFYIRTNCGGGDFSNWVGPLSFTTAYDCTAYTDAPFFEDFASDNAFYSCYVIEDTNTDGTAWIHQYLDLDGDLIEEDFATSGANGTSSKNDWLFSPPITLTIGNDYNFTFKFNGANATNPANESLEVVLIDAAASTGNVLTSLHSQTGITQSGTFAQLESLAYVVNAPTYTATASGEYYLGFHMTTPAPTGFLLLFEYGMTETLSVGEFERNSVTHFYNLQNDILTLKSSNSNMESIAMYNLLGQEILVRDLSSNIEDIDMSNFTNGLYIAKISIGNRTQTIKILKQ